MPPPPPGAALHKPSPAVAPAPAPAPAAALPADAPRVEPKPPDSLTPPADALSSAQVKLAAPGLRGVNGVKEEVAAFYAEHFAQQLALHGMRVITTSEIAALIGLERQKQMVGGCSDSSESCIAELAGALGVDGIVTGSIGQFGRVFQVNLKILKAGDGAVLASHSNKVESEEAVLEDLTKAAHQMAPLVRKRLGRKWDGVVVTQTDVSPLRRWFWVPAAVGGVAGGAGGYLMLQSKAASDRLRGTSGQAITTVTEAETVMKTGQTQQTVGVALLGTAAAGLVSAGVMYLLGAPAPVQATAALTPNGTSFGVAGGF